MFNQGRDFRSDNGYIVPMAAFAGACALWSAIGAAVAWFRYARLRVTR